MFKIIRNIFNAIGDVLERFLIKATHYIEGPDASYIEEIKNMENAVNVFLCRDDRDIQMSMQEYADSERLTSKDVKLVRSRSTVTVNGGWIVKFVSTASGLDGMDIREISISTRLATGGDVKKLTHMLTMARAGRVGMKARQEEEWS